MKIAFPFSRQGLKTNKTRRWFLSLLTVVGLTLFLLVGVHFKTSAQNSTTAPLPHLPAYQILTDIPATAQQVKVGFYGQNIYELNQSSNTYYIDFYIWFKWKGELNPTEDFEFMNGVDDWGLTQVPIYDQPLQLPDGTLLQVIRVEGRFAEPFKFLRYPLDQQRLGVTIENSSYPLEKMVFVPDNEQSGYAEGITIPGWQLEKYQILQLFHPYKTNFGVSTIENETCAAIRYELVVNRPTSYFAWKLLLPLIIVLFASWGALLLDPTRIDSRITLTMTALLTTVFLQQSYASDLPAVSYLVLLDKIYVIAYILIIGAILETILTADMVKNDSVESIAKVRKIDRILLTVNIVFLVLGTTLLLLL